MRTALWLPLALGVRQYAASHSAATRAGTGRDGGVSPRREASRRRGVANMCWWRGESCRTSKLVVSRITSRRAVPPCPPPRHARRRLAIGSASDISYRGGLGGHVVGRARRTQARAHFRQGHTWRARPDRACALVATRPRRGLKRCARLLWPSDEALYGGRVPWCGGGHFGPADAVRFQPTSISQC